MKLQASLLALALFASPALTLSARAQESEAALAAAGVITRAQAIAIAEAAVPNTKLIAAHFERNDSPPHWSVDLLGSTYEYEVWVSVGGKVLRVITQPK